MKLYIVQAEEGSGIPGVPEVYTDKDEAVRNYEEAWREAWTDDLRYLHDEAAIKAEVDKIMAGDFDSDWPEDGGVRFWQVDADIEEARS